MSESDVDSLRRGYEAFNRRDIEGLLTFFDPDATWIPSSSAWGAGRAYHGHEGVARLFEDLERNWQEFEALPHEFRQVGDLILVLGRVRATPKGGGKEIRSPRRLLSLRDTARAMSQENVEVVQRVYEAFNRGDLDAVVADIAPDAEYFSTGTIPGFAGAYRGREGLRRFLSWFWEEFDEPHIEVHEIIEAGDQLLVSLTMRGRGKQSGADVSWHIWHVVTVRDGRFVRGQGFTSRDEALEAVGLSEQDVRSDS